MAEGARVDGLAVVRMDHDSEHDFMDENGEEGTFHMIAHLISLGHRWIACIAAPLAFMFAALHCRRCQRAQLRNGVYLSIAGFDDIPSSAMLFLTAQLQPVYEIGKQLSQMLVSTLRGEASGKREGILQPERIVRASIGPSNP